MFAKRPTLRSGLIVGLVAYVTGAVFYSALDMLAARDALFTVDMLGRALFRGLRDPAVLMFPLEIDPVAVVWYHGLHLAGALGIGLVATALLAHATRHPGRVPLILGALLAGGVIMVAMIATLMEPMRPVLPWWSMVVANGVAAGLAGVYVLRCCPNPWLRAARAGAEADIRVSATRVASR